MVTDSKSIFAPISYDLIQNTPSSNETIGRLVSGDITIARLFACAPELFARVRNEVMAVVTTGGGQTLDPGHPTFDYITKWDPSWKPKPNTITQYSLLNSKHDLSFFGEDHHWYPERSLDPRLRAVPEFVRTYFKDSELQNFRIQAIAGGGELGMHRERIVAIPRREQHYKLRFHLPIVTNPRVSFVMEGEHFRMEAGAVYIFNQSCLHGVANEGDELRVHLVFDAYLNDYLVQELIAPAVSGTTAVTASRG